MDEELTEHITKARMLMSQISELARGVVVVDEHLASLVPLLARKSIIVISLKRDVDDEDMKGDLLAHRNFVTNNSENFLYDAVEYEFSIIATEAVSKDPQSLTAMISHALTDYSLWSKRFGWILRLSSDGRHQLKKLEES